MALINCVIFAPEKSNTFINCSADDLPTKLERAQEIAAEVRARKFPPVKRIGPAPCPHCCGDHTLSQCPTWRMK
jgi:hypothetical protein